MNLSDLLFRSATDPDDPVVHAGGSTLLRHELETAATDIACATAELGLRAGQAVAVMLPNGADLIAALFGVWRAGGVYVPINPRLTDRELAHVLDTINPAVVMTGPADEDRFDSRAVLVVGNGSRPQQRPGPTGARVHDDDVALISFTSGTTGAPKAVKLTHSGVIALIDGVLEKLRGQGRGPSSAGPTSPRPSTPNLIPVSLSLWAGIYNVLFAFRTGAPVVVMEHFDTLEFQELVSRFEIKSSVLPPAAMTMLINDTRLTDLTPLRFVRSITAPLSPLQAARFRDRFGISVLNGWGQTEIGGEIVGWSAADSRAFGETKLGAVGRPHRGVDIRVVDDVGEPAEPGHAGELWVKTPAMSAGYVDGTDLADRLSPDGFFRTGDIGRVDSDGFVWIEGRASDMINRGGMKVHPSEVEEVLRLSPAVADVAVVGVADDRLGEVPVAFVVAASDGRYDATSLEALCREHLSSYKVPVAFEWLEALPRNQIGKVLVRELAIWPNQVTG